MKSKLPIFAISFILIFYTNFFSQTKEILRLGTALKSGSYFPLGESIKNIFKKNGFVLEVHETNGSVDNMNLLNEDLLDIIIVQNDIAFFADNGLYPFEQKVENLNGIISFYEEPIYIVTNSASIVNIEQLRHLKINVGPEGGGLYTDARIILNSVHLWTNIDKHYYSPDVGVSSLLQNQIQATFINNIPDSVLSMINNNQLFIIPLSRILIENLIQTYPYFSNLVHKVGNKEIATICVKSILICKSNLDREIIYDLTKNLYNKYEDLVFPNNVKTNEKQNLLLGMPLQNWHRGSERFYNEIGLISSNIILKYIWLLLLIPVLGILILLIANLVLVFLRKQNVFLLNLNSNLIYIVRKAVVLIAKYKYIVIVLIIITLFLSDLIWIQFLEHKWAIKNNIISDFDNRSFIKNILWLFVFGGSGFNGDIFPNDPIAQFLVTLVPMIGLGGILAIIGFLTSDHIKNHILEIKGLKSKMIRNHIIICGWNKNVPTLLRDLMNKDYTHKKPVIVLADIDEEVPLAKYNFDKTVVSYIKGDSTKREDLERANFKEADVVVIVGDDKSTDPDARNILKTLTIENYSKELEEKGIRKKENIYSILELVDVHDSNLAKEAKVDEIISLGEIKSKIMVQSIHNPGVSQFFNEILNFNDYNELYSLKIEKNSKLSGKTFDELLILFRKHNILLVSINLRSFRKLEELKIILNEHNLKREVITNPITSYENSYKVQEKDVLIVLAENEKVIDNLLRDIKVE